MTTPAKTRRFLALLAAGLLGLTACSSGDDEAQAQDTGLETLLATDARDDQRAAGGAAAMAGELGFDQVQPIAAADIQRVREAAAERGNDTAGLDVTPAECAGPIAELDWSPIQADSTEVTRVDFGRSTFTGVGSIEVAGITEANGADPAAAEQLANHRSAIETILTQCSDITMMLADTAEPDWAAIEYTFTAQPVDTDTGSGLLWQRYPTEDPETNRTTALTMMTEYDGYAIMVAFIGPDDIAESEFTDIAETLLASATAQLD